MILTGEFTFTNAIAFPENTFIFIEPSVSGNDIAPETKPALSLTETLGATPFPIKSCENITVSAFNDKAKDEIRRANCCESSPSIVRFTKIDFAPYFPSISNSLAEALPHVITTTCSFNLRA